MAINTLKSNTSKDWLTPEKLASGISAVTERIKRNLQDLDSSISGFEKSMLALQDQMKNLQMQGQVPGQGGANTLAEFFNKRFDDITKQIKDASVAQLKGNLKRLENLEGLAQDSLKGSVQGDSVYKQYQVLSTKLRDEISERKKIGVNVVQFLKKNNIDAISITAALTTRNPIIGLGIKYLLERRKASKDAERDQKKLTVIDSIAHKQLLQQQLKNQKPGTNRKQKLPKGKHFGTGRNELDQSKHFETDGNTPPPNTVPGTPQLVPKKPFDPNDPIDAEFEDIPNKTGEPNQLDAQSAKEKEPPEPIIPKQLGPGKFRKRDVKGRFLPGYITGNYVPDAIQNRDEGGHLSTGVHQEGEKYNTLILDKLEKPLGDLKLSVVNIGKEIEKFHGDDKEKTDAELDVDEEKKELDQKNQDELIKSIKLLGPGGTGKKELEGKKEKSGFLQDLIEFKLGEKIASALSSFLPTILEALPLAGLVAALAGLNIYLAAKNPELAKLGNAGPGYNGLGDVPPSTDPEQIKLQQDAYNKEMGKTPTKKDDTPKPAGYIAPDDPYWSSGGKIPPRKVVTTAPEKPSVIMGPKAPGTPLVPPPVPPAATLTTPPIIPATIAVPPATTPTTPPIIPATIAVPPATTPTTPPIIPATIAPITGAQTSSPIMGPKTPASLAYQNEKSKITSNTGQPQLMDTQNVKDMHIDDAGLDALKQFETGGSGKLSEDKLSPYPDPIGIPTIGYGHRIKPGENFTKISQTEADALLKKDIPIYEKMVKKSIKVPLTQEQFNSLVDLAYNTGGDESTKYTTISKTVSDLINQGNFNGAGEWLKGHYITGQGTKKKLPGLVKRRNKEASAFIPGNEGTQVAAMKPPAPQTGRGILDATKHNEDIKAQQANNQNGNTIVAPTTNNSTTTAHLSMPQQDPQNTDNTFRDARHRNQFSG